MPVLGLNWIGKTCLYPSTQDNVYHLVGGCIPWIECIIKLLETDISALSLLKEVKLYT